MFDFPIGGGADEYAYGMGGMNPLGAGGSVNPALGLMMLQKPEAVASSAAAAGIPPPPPAAPPAGFGDMMEPNVPMPQPRPPEAGPSAADLAANAQSSGFKMPSSADIQKTLKGVAAPTPPTPQRISSPPPPRPRNAIQSGQLMQLLQAMGAAPQQRPLFR